MSGLKPKIKRVKESTHKHNDLITKLINVKSCRPSLNGHRWI